VPGDALRDFNVPALCQVVRSPRGVEGVESLSVFRPRRGIPFRLPHFAGPRGTRAGVKAARHRSVRIGRKVTPEQIDRARKLIDRGETLQ
jgi:hypothetical protein